MTAHVNELNLIISWLISVDIGFEDQVQALLLLLSFLASWSGTLMTISSLIRNVKLTFKGIHDLNLSKDVYKRIVRESSIGILSAKDIKDVQLRRWAKGRSISRIRGISKDGKDVTYWNLKRK